VSRERCDACGVPVPQSSVPMFTYQWRIGHADACRPRALTVERFGDPSALERERGTRPR